MSVTNPTLAEEVEGLLAGRRPDLLRDPYPLYARLRAESPALRLGSQVLLFRYADVKAACNDPRALKVFGSADRLVAQTAPEQRGQLAETLAWFRTWLTQSNGEDHVRLRKLVSRAFTPVMIGKLRAQIQETTDELLDDVKSGAEFEVISQFAFHLPLIVICRMLDVPVEDRFAIRDWAAGLTQLIGGDADVGSACARVSALREHLGRVVSDRRHNGTNSPLLAALFEAEETGDRLSNDELVTMIVHLVFGGHETTTNLIGNGLLALLRHRDQWDRLAADPALLSGAVEELLRYDTPVQETHRGYAEEVELRGVAVHPGDTVRLILASANHDAEIFDQPEQLDVTRDSAMHLSFGFGSRYCLGNALARLEAEVALGSLQRRYPGMQLAVDEPERQPQFTLHALVALPVRL